MVFPSSFLSFDNLAIHLLTLMDFAAVAERYLSLPYCSAESRCHELIETTRRHKGELVALWHNTELVKPYHKALYKSVLRVLAS